MPSKEAHTFQESLSVKTANEGPGSRHVLRDKANVTCILEPTDSWEWVIWETLMRNETRRCCFSDFRSFGAHRRSMGNWPGTHVSPEPSRRGPCSALKTHLPLSRTEAPDLLSLPVCSFSPLVHTVSRGPWYPARRKGLWGTCPQPSGKLALLPTLSVLCVLDCHSHLTQNFAKCNPLY